MTIAVAALALSLAGAAGPQPYTVDAARSAIRFHVHHKLHAADGRSSSIEGKAIVQPDGKVLAMVRIPVATFDSGDANRDANMRDTLEAGRFPSAASKAITTLVLPAALGTGLPTTTQRQLPFPAVPRPATVPI